MPVERSRNTIGQNRTWILGRVFGGIWFLVVAIHALWIGLIIRLVYAVIDALYTFLLDRQLGWGETWSAVPLMYGIKWGKYPLGMASYPGLIPRKSMGRRRNM